MSTLELKHIITEQLSKIDDFQFLSALKTIIESKASDRIYELSDLQINRIKMAREDLQNGLTISHEDVQIEINQWLNSK